MDDLDRYRPKENKRNRSMNFTADEKKLLLRLASPRKLIIENRKTDNATNYLKAQAWIDIANEYNARLSGPKRDAKVLRMKYDSVKREIRKAVGMNGKDFEDGRNPWKEIKGVSLTEEEMELKETMILSYEGLLPTDSDLGKEVPLTLPANFKAINHNKDNGENGEGDDDENDDDDDDDCEEADDNPVIHAEPTNAHSDNDIKPNISFNDRRRQFKTRVRQYATSKLEELRKDAGRRINGIKEKTAWIERETAEVNLAAAKSKLRTAQIYEEIASIKKRKLMEEDEEEGEGNDVELTVLE